MVLRLGLIKLNLQILRFPFPLYLWACLTTIQKQLTNCGSVSHQHEYNWHGAIIR